MVERFAWGYRKEYYDARECNSIAPLHIASAFGLRKTLLKILDQRLLLHRRKLEDGFSTTHHSRIYGARPNRQDTIAKRRQSVPEELVW